MIEYISAFLKTRNREFKKIWELFIPGCHKSQNIVACLIKLKENIGSRWILLGHTFRSLKNELTFQMKAKNIVILINIWYTLPCHRLLFFSDMLVTDFVEPNGTSLPSPEQLKNRIILKVCRRRFTVSNANSPIPEDWRDEHILQYLFVVWRYSQS